MSYMNNTLTRRNQRKSDDLLESDEQIERIEEDMRKLKVDFDIYFNGGTKKAPHQKRASLEARMNKLNGNRDLSFAQRYKLNNLVSRYTSFKQLWRRKLKTKGDEIY